MSVPTDRRGRAPSSAARNRRMQIIEEATVLFRENGFHATTLDEVAARIGFTKAAIYYYFDTKEDVLFAIVGAIMDGVLVRVRAISSSPGTAGERLHALLVENTRTIVENIDANTVFYNERGLLSAARERQLRVREREYTVIVRNLYSEGVATGELLDVDPVVAAATLIGASVWTYRWFDDAGVLSAQEVAEQIARLLLRGYLC